MKIIKLFGLLGLMGSGLFAQSTLSYTFPGTNEPAVSAVFSSADLSAIQGGMLYNPTCAYGTLSSSALSTDTTLQLGSTFAASLVAGNGLLVDSEIIRVSSVSGSVATVARGMAGTTATGHSGGATVKLLIAGSYGEMLKLLIDVGLSNINANNLYPAGVCRGTPGWQNSVQ